MGTLNCGQNIDMKIINHIPLFLLVAIGFSCSNNREIKHDANSSINLMDGIYSQSFADSLGADDYGMKTYVMALLNSGPNRSADSLEAANLQAAHMKNINRMAEEGSLVMAGPFLDNTQLRGIYVFNVETIAEAEELTKTDPMIQAGVLVFEFHPWYGSAVSSLTNTLHKKVMKTNF